MKSAKEWVEEYMATPEGKAERAAWDEELKNYFLYGAPTQHFDNSLLKEIVNYKKQ